MFWSSATTSKLSTAAKGKKVFFSFRRNGRFKGKKKNYGGPEPQNTICWPFREKEENLRGDLKQIKLKKP